MDSSLSKALGEMQRAGQGVWSAVIHLAVTQNNSTKNSKDKHGS